MECRLNRRIAKWETSPPLGTKSYLWILRGFESIRDDRRKSKSDGKSTLKKAGNTVAHRLPELPLIFYGIKHKNRSNRGKKKQDNPTEGKPIVRKWRREINMQSKHNDPVGLRH